MVNNDSAVAPAFQSIEDFYRRVYWQAPTATTVSAGPYTMSYSGVAWLHSVNHLWLHEMHLSQEQIGGYLSAANHFFRPYNADYNIVFSETSRADFSEQLEAHGYYERLRNPLLLLEGLPRAGVYNRDTHVVHVTEHEKHDLLQVLRETFYLGPELSRCIVRPDQMADPATRHYLAYANGEPACCVTVLLGANGIASVWNVGTVRHFRRRGLASTVMRIALWEAAAEGCSISILLASPMGRPLYEAMGYHCIGETAAYCRFVPL